MCALIGKMHEFLLALKKAGFTDKLIQRVINSENNEMATKMFAAIAPYVVEFKPAKIEVISDFTVDYARTVEEMVAAGKYDSASDEITSFHYPIPGDKIGKKEDISTRLFNLSSIEHKEYKVILREDAIEAMHKEGFRPATAHEIMAFGEKNPELQRQFQIYALGSCWKDGLYYCFLLLTSNQLSKPNRKLGLDKEDGYYKGSRFLGVKINSMD